MNRFNLMKVGLMLAIPFALSGCIDDDYDLSDIDGTVELQVKDFTIPMNIDAIKLENIINIDGNGQIKEIDGEYVFIEEGDFNSGKIKVPVVEIDAPMIEPTITKLELQVPELPNIPMDVNGTQIDELCYALESNVSDFVYETHSVSDYIISMEKIGTELTVKMTFDLVGLDILESYSLRNFKLQLPKGLDMKSEYGEYDETTGVLAIKDGPHTGHSLEFIMSVSAIDIAAADIEYNHDTHTIIFDGEIGIHSGEIVVTNDDVEGDLASMIMTGTFPQTIDLKSEYDLSDILVKTFTGDIKYTLEAIDVAPIVINNIPDILSQDETDIVLSNPQIYLSLNNPLSEYNLYAQSGLTITANSKSGVSTPYSLDNGYFTIAANPMNVFCMSPSVPDKYYAGYEDAEHVPYSALANVLSGDGLPASIGVTLEAPNVPVQQVNEFQLGKDFGAIQGKYTFYTPLELGADSKIVYASTEDGWNDEEVDAITIKVMEITASVTNNLPLDIEITGYPIDVEGNRINNAKFEGVSVKANAVDQPLNIRITEEIKHLDGIYFEAVAEPNGAENVLRPTEYILLKDLKVKVSGNYIDEL